VITPCTVSLADTVRGLPGWLVQIPAWDLSGSREALPMTAGVAGAPSGCLAPWAGMTAGVAGAPLGTGPAGFALAVAQDNCFAQSWAGGDERQDAVVSWRTM
jgi:hypothetical protein